ncbi:Leu/Phe/Val dehydrogenase [Tenuibacillus multivorans]|uniref:Phenylalanine dehydrogenase n=1 Tax=Tenuibacillus multivorans TaxID=237069 RepID=A0A1H0BVV1_9BACI|nr:Glu/Leu/Phe/Val dehydrogenase [Tenuibacillus multivorans]GEL77013.1 leucine dehydrogenase [Tenuibacillus multivorans]SDN49782.1 phenylalanine dehydrogenase [Tenuibacillus multivorans]
MSFITASSKNDNFALLEKMSEHEQVVFCNDPSTNLQAIIAIHSTKLGPAIGGCRMHPYESFDDALDDALRLSKGMTYKCAAADVDFGGGKSVIIGDPQKDKTPELFRAFGQFVDSLGGRFYTGTDMGTTLDDFVHAMKETNNIAGLPEVYGGGGDSSIPTAEGVLYGLKATSNMLFDHENLSEVTFAIQGLGKVGFKVAERLLDEGATLMVTDINDTSLNAIQERAQTTNGSVTIVDSNDIYAQPADIFVPCAFGGIINDTTLNQFQFKAIAGSANSQLLKDEHGVELAKRGILYAPDYIINSGGLIQVSDELYGANKERVLHKTKEIYNTMINVYQQAELDHISTVVAANQICEKMMANREKRNSFFKWSSSPKWHIRH